MEILKVKIQGEGYLLNNTMYVPKSDGNREYELIKQWLSEGNTPEPEFDLNDLKKLKINKINLACQDAIISGFTSNALGYNYFYYSTLEEQTTLNSIINLGIDSNFKCQKISVVDNIEVKENRVQVPHTLTQLKQVLVDGAIHIKAQIDRKDLLEIQINNATTAAELELINW